MDTTIFLFTLLVKHAFCDLYLQFKKTPMDKTRYIGECHSHYFDHSILTFIICYIFLIPIEYSIFLCLVDYILHWHIDFVKTKIMKFLKIEHNSVIYWLFQTVDQILHYSTYLLIVYIVKNYSSFHNFLEKFISFFSQFL